MGQDLRTDARLIRAATASALQLASDHGLTSMAFPALGTGVGGFPVDECARLMVGALKDLVTQRSDTPLRHVEFVLFGQKAYDEFRRGAESVTED
jgi:O-acetyl-ADP-ribose deacetylase (regulator of RNase III)